MAGTPKNLKALWDDNKKVRKAALSNKLSPQALQGLPPQLRGPIKLYGFSDPKNCADPPSWISDAPGRNLAKTSASVIASTPCTITE